MEPKLKKKIGMTRTEVIVCLTLGFLMVLLVASHIISHTRREVAASKYLINARGIYISVNLIHLENQGLTGSLPSTLAFLPDHTEPQHRGSSTGYFRYLMEHDILFQEFTLFSGPSARIKTATSIDNFTEKNNGWAVVSGQNFASSPSESPLIISRNLNESALIDWQGDEDLPLQNLGRKAGNEGWRTPFNHHVVVLIRMNGSGESLKEKDYHRWKYLNPHSETNVVMQP